MTSLRVGDSAPDFWLPDVTTGVALGRSGLDGRDGLLLFLRGTWCPYCRRQLDQLRTHYESLTQAGIGVLAVTCQGADSVRRYLQADPLPFPLLADERRVVARQYGVHYWLSYDGVNLARPSLFILDRASVLTFVHIGRRMNDLPLERVLTRFLDLLQDPSSV
jgi:peroxiredoxin Q/BCP